jgi:UDP-glucose 4-epimerase
MKSYKISIISGGAGFIGANIIPRLLAEDRRVVIFDNLVRGKLDFINPFLRDDRVSFLHVDLSNQEAAEKAFQLVSSKGLIDEVWHLAANSDIPAGVDNFEIDLKDTFQTTVEILRQMKRNGISHLYFASSSAVYGDHGSTPLMETTGPLLPISNYGAMKLASEALISAAAESFLSKVKIFRFPNVVGIPASHGVILDFIIKLNKSKNLLTVLGNGSQRKSYLHVSDLVSAMLYMRSIDESPKIDIINLGPIDNGVTVKWIAEEVVERVNPDATIQYGNEVRGWLGDVPMFNYSTQKAQQYGWSPKLSSAQAIRLAINEIITQEID